MTAPRVHRETRRNRAYRRRITERRRRIIDTEAIIRVDATEVKLPLSVLSDTHLRACEPVRLAQWHPKQRHLPGWYWSTTEQTHFMYESRLELVRLQLADFSPRVVAIRAQPFRLESCALDGRRRSHIPDFALLERDGTVRIVNVKSPDRIHDPRVQSTFAWVNTALEQHGFATEIWTGVEPIVIANVQFIAGYRNAALFRSEDIEKATSVLAHVATIGELESALATLGVARTRAVVMHLLWTGRIGCELEHPIDAKTEVSMV